MRDTKRCCWCWLAAPYWETVDGLAVLAVTAALIGLPGADAGAEGAGPPESGAVIWSLTEASTASTEGVCAAVAAALAPVRTCAGGLHGSRSAPWGTVAEGPGKAGLAGPCLGLAALACTG